MTSSGKVRIYELFPGLAWRARDVLDAAEEAVDRGQEPQQPRSAAMTRPAASRLDQPNGQQGLPASCPGKGLQGATPNASHPCSSKAILSSRRP